MCMCLCMCVLVGAFGPVDATVFLGSISTEIHVCMSCVYMCVCAYLYGACGPVN